MKNILREDGGRDTDDLPGDADNSEAGHQSGETAGREDVGDVSSRGADGQSAAPVNESDTPVNEQAEQEIEGWNDEEKPDTAGAEVSEEDEKVPIVCIKGLRKSFKDHEVLRGVDLHVNKGENLVILGKSGSGKSVLIKCLVRLEWPDEGEMEVFGRNIADLKYDELNEIRLKTGFLFQNAALYDSMTVRENLAFPLKQHKKKVASEKREELIMEMLDNVGLADAIDQMPSKLSGGQAKRIGLARTLILRPQLMLYDEPTTGLDTGTAKEISELMIKMKQKYNISSITITHDMACARMTADRIIMLKEGAVVAEGSYEDLEKSDDEWIKSFFS